MTNQLLYPSLVTSLALLVYWGFTLRVGAARGQYKVPAPQTTGDPAFERVLRVQQNTMEQLLSFLPTLWIFSLTLSPIWAAGLGGLWIVGRIVYAVGYYAAAEKRGPGFAITALASFSLLIGSLVGTAMQLAKGM
jgi:uncharacterized MAPEG superfamily protein